MRIPVCKFAQMNRLDMLLRQRFPFRFTDAFLLQAEGDVLQHGQPREKGVLLKHNDPVGSRTFRRFAVHDNRLSQLDPAPLPG